MRLISWVVLAMVAALFAFSGLSLIAAAGTVAAPVPDKQAHCVQHQRLAGLVLEWWKAGHTRAQLVTRTDATPADVADANRAADEAYIAIAGILALHGRDENIQRAAFEASMFDACMADS